MSSGTRRGLLQAAGLSAAMAGASAAAWWLTPRRLLADDGPRLPLSEAVPPDFDTWRVARDVRLVPPAPDVQQALERVYDDTLARAYRSAGGALVMLSLAYARQQRGETILHRPDVCYAGQGFTVQARDDTALLDLGGRRIAATRLVARGPRAEPVTYWLVLAGQVVRFGLEWRLATLAHGLRGAVADGLLVRLSSVDADAHRAFALHDRFAAELAAMLPPATARRLFGGGP